jgi:hypothetical protein
MASVRGPGLLNPIGKGTASDYPPGAFAPAVGWPDRIGVISYAVVVYLIPVEHPLTNVAPHIQQPKGRYVIWKCAAGHSLTY